MIKWIPIWVLPNLRLKDAIDGKSAALVPLHDPRLIELANQHRSLKRFLSKFRDPFGVPVKPTVLIARAPNKKSRRLRVDLLASFRAVVALSVIPYSRALNLVYGSRHRVTYSNNFWLYPWMLDKDYEYLITSTMAQLGLHDVNKFNGQATPEIPTLELSAKDIDQVLFDELISRWHSRYKKPKPDWSNIALFRSLNMANAACQLPAVADATMYDVGRSLALWVSAFEILAHPGVGKSNLGAVYGLLDKVDMIEKRMQESRYGAFDPASKKRVPSKLVRWIYHELYQARNDFIHGNPVSRGRLRPKGSRASLLELAPPLYRLALTAFLSLKFSEKAPPISNPNAFAEFLTRRMNFTDYQHIIERGLMRARKSSGSKASSSSRGGARRKVGHTVIFP